MSVSCHDPVTNGERKSHPTLLRMAEPVLLLERLLHDIGGIEARALQAGRQIP